MTARTPLSVQRVFGTSTDPPSATAVDPSTSWTDFLARTTVRWDGTAATWEAFSEAFHKDAKAHQMQGEAEALLDKASSRAEEGDRVRYLAVYGLTVDHGDLPDLRNYGTTLYRYSDRSPDPAKQGWGTNVYAALFPTGIEPTPQQGKALLGRASQQPMGSFLYRFPLDSVVPAHYKYMNLAAPTLQRVFPDWDHEHRMVEVICREAPALDQIEISVAGKWTNLLELGRK